MKMQATLTKLEETLLSERHDSEAVGKALHTLLVELCAENTPENCRLVDSHVFSIIADNDLGWLQGELKAIIEDIGGTLHDTHEHPEIAKNFFSTPPQLLERIVNARGIRGT